MTGDGFTFALAANDHIDIAAAIQHIVCLGHVIPVFIQGERTLGVRGGADHHAFRFFGVIVAMMLSPRWR